MKIRKLNEGDMVEVGDLLRHETWMGRKHFRVERVTKCYAFVRINEVCLQKYKRSIDRDRIRACGDNDQWSQVVNSFWRPIVDDKTIEDAKAAKEEMDKQIAEAKAFKAEVENKITEEKG